MKNIYIKIAGAFIFSFSVVISVSAKETDMKTSITDVTVFQNGAQVKRTGSAMIPSGESEIVISDATSLFKKESLQVKGDGDFTILSVSSEAAYEDVDNQKSQWPELEAKQKDLMKQMEDLSVQIQTLNAQEKTILELKKTNTSQKGITVDQVSKAQETIDVKLTLIRNQKLAASRKILDLFDEHKTVTQHLVALKSPKQKVKYHIVIKVSAKAEVKGNFSITYVVPNAKWFPSYDLRVNSISDPMHIEYKANISQESGEDWSNVKLKLSTGDPSQSSEKPKVDPWWLYMNNPYVSPMVKSNFYQYTDLRFTGMKGTVINQETGEAVPWCTVLVHGTDIGTMADEKGNFSLVLPDNAQQLDFISVGYQAQGFLITDPVMTAKIQKKELPLNEVVKTDYEKQLLTLQSPVMGTDYNGDLMTLNVPVDPIYKDARIKSMYDYSVSKQNLENYVQMNSVDKMMNTSAGNYSSDYEQSEKMLQTMPLSVNKVLNIVNAEYSIDEKYSIPSSPKSVMVPVQDIETHPSYQYYCAPRLDKDVFLTAQLTDWEQYNLLEGPANVFFEGTFVGNTFFDTRYLVDTLSISLGRDKSVKVERKKSNEYEKHEVIGSDNISYREWDITARNAKSQSIDLVIEDQFPVAASSNVTVTQEEKSDGKLDENSGIVTWTLKIQPSETKTLQLKYKVKYPKEDFVGLD